jgi:hypothetical protein
VLLTYGIFIIDHLQGRYSAAGFIELGTRFLTRSHASPTITDALRLYPPSERSPVGYDGQFFYYIALDAAHAAPYIDDPAYRYGRIGYPTAAWLLALGRPAWIPYTLILVNLLAITGGTYAAALWLRRQCLSPWLALLYGLYSGLFMGLLVDTSEPLAYGLVATAVLLLGGDHRARGVSAGLVFAAAVLTREIAGLFPLVLGGSLLLRQAPGQRRLGATVLALALGPYVLWKVLLGHLLGGAGLMTALLPDPIPLHGLFSYWPWPAAQQQCLESAVLPAILLLCLIGWAFARGFSSTEAWLLLANILILIVLLPPASYAEWKATGRITVGVVLAALYCLPLLDRVTHHRRWWLWVVGTLWLALTPSLLLHAV